MCEVLFCEKNLQKRENHAILIKDSENRQLECAMKNLLKKLDNFWYHYKWHTIFIVFFLAVILICTVQCVQKDDPDAMILYSGPEVMTAEGKTVLENLISQRLDKDHNGDGNKLVTLTDVIILSDEQIKEKEEEAKADGEILYYDPTKRTEAFNQAKNWLISGEMLIAILDPFVYEKFEGTNLFVPLSETFEELPSSAYDAYAIDLDKTDFLKYNPELKEAFSGAVMCLVKPTAISMLNGNNGEEWYGVHRTLFRRIVNFEVVS